MIICPKCNKSNNFWPHSCGWCGFKTDVVDGYLSWAPHIAKLNNADLFFEPAIFKKLAALEDNNFWFKSRNKLISDVIDEYCKSATSFMEVGCGTGFVLREIEARSQFDTVIGTELFVEGLKFAKARCSASTLIQMDARSMPYVSHFDVLGSFDVLEHIEQDDLVLQQMHKALKPKGHLILTVPQHPWLWSTVDEAACHVRRYTKNELHVKVQNSGFEVLRSTSFVSLLLPFMLLSRLRASKNKKDSSAELKINPILNKVFNAAMTAERFLINRSVNFSIGGSRILIARKI
jgi:SAM-dependent methyltransferase